MAYISLPSDLNAIIGIKSYCCVILKMVILHDAIKTIQNSVLEKLLKNPRVATHGKNLSDAHAYKHVKLPGTGFMGGTGGTYPPNF